MTAQAAMLRLMKPGLKPEDAYRVLRARGFDPHPKAVQVEISEERLAIEVADWCKGIKEQCGHLLERSK